MFERKSFTFGCELEWGDIDRKLTLPNHLGKWEYSETDIVNLRNPSWGVACDPLGKEPHFGGEINTVPSHTINEQVQKIVELKEFFKENSSEESASMVSHTHIHIHVPGLIEDPVALKKLADYVFKNQQEMVQFCGKFCDSPEITKAKAKMYLKLDGGRLLPEYMYKNIIEHTTDIDSFLKMHCAGKDAVSMGRPFRYGINMYSLKHTKTVEFRMFRSTVDPEQIRDIFEICTQFLDAALNDGPDFSKIMESRPWNLPKFWFDIDLWESWKKSKYPKERGKKEREFYEI